jgi:hypothetical protein
VYIVETRYEYQSKEGKKFCDWYGSKIFEEKEDADKLIATLKESCKSIDKATKCKHEFRRRELSEKEIKELEEIAKVMNERATKAKEKRLKKKDTKAKKSKKATENKKQPKKKVKDE